MSYSMKDRLEVIGCYPTLLGVEVANETGAEKIRENITADLADLGPADLLAVHVVTSSLAYDARRHAAIVAEAETVLDLGELDGLADELEV